MAKKIKKTKKRSHWLAKSYIYLLMFLHGMVVFLTVLVMAMAQQQKLQHPIAPGSLEATFVLAIVNIYFLLTLLRLRRWGFYGYCLGSIAAVGLSIYMGTEFARALLGFASLAVLAGLLFMGGRRSFWQEMK